VCVREGRRVCSAISAQTPDLFIPSLPRLLAGAEPVRGARGGLGEAGPVDPRVGRWVDEALLLRAQTIQGLGSMPTAMEAGLEATKKNVRDAVVLFEHKEGSKLVDMKDVGALVRSLGVNPSGVQLNLILDQVRSRIGGRRGGRRESACACAVHASARTPRPLRGAGACAPQTSSQAGWRAGGPAQAACSPPRMRHVACCTRAHPAGCKPATRLHHVRPARVLSPRSRLRAPTCTAAGGPERRGGQQQPAAHGAR